MLAMNC